MYGGGKETRTPDPLHAMQNEPRTNQRDPREKIAHIAHLSHSSRAKGHEKGHALPRKKMVDRERCFPRLFGDQMTVFLHRKAGVGVSDPARDNEPIDPRQALQ